MKIRQISNPDKSYVLTNTNVFSLCANWIVTDCRTQDDQFNSTQIIKINIATKEEETLIEAKNGAHVGVATFSPRENRVIFIHGPESPDESWSYAPNHRRGVIHDGEIKNLDARDMNAPFTKGALRGGTHLHQFSGDGEWVSFTYDDAIVSGERNVGVSLPTKEVNVPKGNRNHNGSFYSVLLSETKLSPQKGSDEISRAFSNSWVGKRSGVSFLGSTLNHTGEKVDELFIVELPKDVESVLKGCEDSLVQGDTDKLPAPPKGIKQRRLTFTSERKFPGIQGPRHWTHCSPDGNEIGFYMKDDKGIVQFWTIESSGESLKQVSHNDSDICSSFNWSPDGKYIAYLRDGSIFSLEVINGVERRLTTKGDYSILPWAVVWSPDQKSIVFQAVSKKQNQIFLIEL